jgi:hypothetical protein
MAFTVTHTAVCGQLAESGSPRGWDSNGAISPIEGLADVYNGQRPNSDEWYTPARRVLDMAGADALHRSPVTELLGLRTWHLSEVNVPLYVFATQRPAENPPDSGVLNGARRFVAASRIREAMLTSDEQMLHFDPLYARADRNTFLATVVPFLRRI